MIQDVIQRLVGTATEAGGIGKLIRTADKSPLYLSSRNQRLRSGPRGVSGQLKIPPQSAKGLRWQTPDKELDVTKPVAKDTLVFISPGNSLVANGMIDLVSGGAAKSQTGIWCAAQSVPATITGSGQYNVPQFPYPDATGNPSGSPLAGDVDGDNVFWIFVGPGTGGGGGLVVLYDPTKAYSGGQLVYKTSGKWVGMWLVTPGQNIAANTNNIENLTLPVPANIPWIFVVPSLQTVGGCSATGGTTFFGSLTGPI